MRLIDISPRISPRIKVWPGDTPFTATKLMRFSQGDHLDLGSIQTTLHLGAHTDAPLHYRSDGADMADVPLEPYYGPCQVIDVDARRGKRFAWTDLKQTPTALRILFKTGTFPDPEDWNEDFTAPEPDVVHRLGAQGVVLMGLDTPSTDVMDSKDLASHQELHRYKMANLEGLVLDHVPAGHYTLCAFPLKIEDGDGSPVRAVLITGAG